jgi:hypothetical protein
VELGATLANENLAAVNYLTTKSFDSKKLCIGIATITG